MNMSGNFEFYPVSQHNLILSTSQMEKWNFIQLSDPKLNFISLSGKSAVGQDYTIRGDPHILIASSSRYYTRIFSLLDEESNHTETVLALES